MRTIPPAMQAALDSRSAVMRDFLWIVARDASDGTPVPVGYWSDLGTVSANVMDPTLGVSQARTFRGAGGLVDISPIPLTSDMSVQEATIALSQVSDANDLVRAYDLKQARVEIFRGMFTTALLQIEPAEPRFVGFVDDIEIPTPSEESEASAIILTCVGHSQEMSRTNTAVRSDAYMRRRDANDSFRRHAATVGTWELNWST